MKPIVFLLAFVAALGSAATFGREYRVAYFARSPELSVFETLATKDGIPDVPLSSRSMREMFETCGQVQQGSIYRFQPPDTRLAIDAACAGLARSALERNPTYGGAHTILMLSSNTANEIADALVLSRLTAPRESWHAKLRLRKGLGLYGTGQPPLDSALENDIGFMVKSAAGRVWLARFYQSEPALRATLTALIDRSPDMFKAGFLQEVRRLGRQ